MKKNDNTVINASGTASGAVVAKKNVTLEQILLNYGLYIAMIILLIAFSVLNTNFLTINNIVNIFDQSAYYLVTAVGIAFILIGGKTDLSIGSQLAFYSVIGSMRLIETGDTFGTLMLLIGLGLLVGFANGIMVVLLGFPPFIATIASGYVVRGIAAYMTQQVTVSGLPKWLTRFAWQKTFGLPNLSLIAIVVVLIALYVLEFTGYGRRLYAVGGNKTAAEVMGIRANAIQISTYVVASMLTVVAAIMLVSRSAVARAATADKLHMECIAACAIGGISLKGGHGHIWGTLIGVLFVCMIRSGLNAQGVSNFWQLIFTGAITIFAAVLDSYKTRAADGNGR